MHIRTRLACITIAVAAAGCGRRAEESRAGASPDISTAATVVSVTEVATALR